MPQAALTIGNGQLLRVARSSHGELIHSASWPRGTGLTVKTVALIDNGSTGVQILPAILKKVKKIFVYIRSKTWVTAAFAQKFAGPNGSNLFFSQEQKKQWEEHPEEYLACRKEIEVELNSALDFMLSE